MKTAAVKSLVYKEFYMARKQLLIGIITFIVFAVMGILVEVSFRSGNLAFLSDAVKDEIKESADLGAILYPVLMLCFLALYLSETSIGDEAAVWKRFCYSVPVSHVDFAAAKYASLLIIILAEVAFSFLYAALVCRIIGTRFSALYAAYILAIVTLTVYMAVMNHIGILLFHTRDKAGLFMVAAIFGIILIPVLTNMNTADTEFTKETVDIELIRSLPWLPIMTLAILAAGCVVSTLLYRRREA